MTRILTVDDSRAVRMLVKKALAELEFEIDEAEDGEKGLAAVESSQPELILLDVTMPVLDGPGMLHQLRRRGVRTPVLLLTAESGTSVIGPMMKQGVCEYIVKPFKPDQLRAKVIEVLQREGIMPADPSAPTADGATAGKQPVDVLVVDDMENVAKKLRTMLPERISFNSCLDRASALTMCRERLYKAVVIDTDIPNVNTSELVRDMKILQPTAAFIALVMRAEKSPQTVVASNGFVSYLSKPFDPAQIEEFVSSHFDIGDLLQVEENVLTPAAYKGSEAGNEVYFRKVQQLSLDAAQATAAACHERLIYNLQNLEPSARLQKLLIRLGAQCAESGLELRVVGSAEVAKLLKQLVETASIPVVETLEAATAA